MAKTKFQVGDQVTVNILTGPSLTRYGRHQHRTGTITERRRSGRETLYRVDFKDQQVLIPSQYLYKGTLILPFPASEKARFKLAKRLKLLKPGDKVVLLDYNAALPYDAAAEAVWPSRHLSGGTVATIVRLGYHHNVIRAEGYPGLWVLPYISTDIIREVL